MLLLQCVQQMFSAVKLDNNDAFRNWFVWICLIGASPAGPRKGEFTDKFFIIISHCSSIIFLNITTLVRRVFF